MALTYEWKLTGLKKQDTADITDLVIGTQWKLTGTNENGTKGTFNGGTPLDIPDSNQEGFIPYLQLSEEIVIGWIRAIVEPNEGYWQHINQQIEKQILEAENVIQQIDEANLPWATPIEEVVEETPVGGE
jgi:hypothetical protein